MIFFYITLSMMSQSRNSHALVSIPLFFLFREFAQLPDDEKQLTLITVAILLFYFILRQHFPIVLLLF